MARRLYTGNNRDISGMPEYSIIAGSEDSRIIGKFLALHNLQLLLASHQSVRLLNECKNPRKLRRQQRSQMVVNFYRRWHGRLAGPMLPDIQTSSDRFVDLCASRHPDINRYLVLRIHCYQKNSEVTHILNKQIIIIKNVRCMMMESQSAAILTKCHKTI